MNEDRRRAILAEIAAAAQEQRQMEPYQFTVMDLADNMGVTRAQAERYARARVTDGLWRMKVDGYDARTGRRAALYWRIEDESHVEAAARRGDTGSPEAV